MGEFPGLSKRPHIGRAIGLLLLSAALACSDPEPGWEGTVETLRACPPGDQTWRQALNLASAEDRLDELLTLSDELARSRAERWEPAWTAGEVLLRTGRPGEAQTRYEEALDRARSAAQLDGVACSANRLGILAFHSGQLQLGDELYREALDAALDAGRNDLASFARNNWAGLLVETGDLPRAQEVLELAERGLRDQAGLEEIARNAAFNRGMIQLALGDANAARETLERVSAEAEQVGDTKTLDAAAVALGNLHRYSGQWDEAGEWYGRVSQENEEMLVRAELGVGRIALARGEFDDAAGLLGRTVERAGENFALLGDYARVFQAEAEMRSGRLEVARVRLDGLIARSDRADAEETEWFARWNLGKLLLLQGRTGDAIDALEQTVAILDRQSAPLNPLGQGFHFLRLRADPYVDLAVAVVRDGGPDLASRVLEIAGRAQARALRRVVAHDGDAAAIASIESLQGALGEHDLLLNYLLGQDRGILLAVTSGRTRAVEIPGRELLGEPLRRYREWIRRPPAGKADVATAPDAGGNDAGQLLRSELLGPVDDLLADARRLYVVPDRELALLPFAALPLSDPGTGGNDAPRYQAQVREVALLPLAGAPPAWPDRRAPVLLGGQPRLDAGSGFAELPWAAYELSRLRELWGEEGSHYLSGEELTLAGLRATGLARFRTVHLATHAVASTRDPRRCAVILSGGERMGIAEIVDLDLSDALIILSACSTGEGELLPGEGVVGLGWAFLRAGARGIVVSQWTVDDAAAARLMVAFHRHMQEGIEPVSALARARREVAAEQPHPAFWAPFVIVLRPRA